MNVAKPAVATVGLLIRKPVAEVYALFTEAEQITKIWFNRSSGSLEEGAIVIWYWDLFDASTQVRVVSLEPNHKILIEWGTDTLNPSHVQWTLEARSANRTYVSIVHSGFDQNAQDLLAKVADSTGGFALVLAAAKAFLEFGIELNIVADRF